MRYISKKMTPTEYNRLLAWFKELVQLHKSDAVKTLEAKLKDTHGGDFSKVSDEDKAAYDTAITAVIKACANEFLIEFGVMLRGAWEFNLSRGWSGKINLVMRDPGRPQNEHFDGHEGHFHASDVPVYQLFISRWNLLGSPPAATNEGHAS